MFLFYVLSFFKKGDNIQGGILFKEIWYSFDVTIACQTLKLLSSQILQHFSLKRLADLMMLKKKRSKNIFLAKEGSIQFSWLGTNENFIRAVMHP